MHENIKDGFNASRIDLVRKETFIYAMLEKKPFVTNKIEFFDWTGIEQIDI
jgi:hypothetical protein